MNFETAFGAKFLKNGLLHCLTEMTEPNKVLNLTAISLATFGEKMKQNSTLSMVHEIMSEFANLTGLSPARNACTGK